MIFSKSQFYLMDDLIRMLKGEEDEVREFKNILHNWWHEDLYIVYYLVSWILNNFVQT